MRTGPAIVILAILTGVFPGTTDAQVPDADFSLPRTADGRPDLNGIWQALNTAAWNLQDHVGQLDVPPGQSVVVSNEIPYQDWAREQKQRNWENRATADPTEAQCFQPGVPRSTYMPFPFEIVQSADTVAFRYEFAHGFRLVPLDGSPHPTGFPGTWMGISRGRWDGDTLVVDVRNFNGDTWFDQAGNFHSDALRVVERYTLTGPDHILYEATIEDENVFTAPWTIRMPLYRRVDENVNLLEYECVFYLQEKRYADAPFD